MTSFYVGASAQTVESAVTTPLEQQINGAQGMQLHHLLSGNDGSSSIVATFDLNRDPDLAAVDVQNRVNTAQGRLPNAVKATGITILKVSTNFVFGAAVFYSRRSLRSAVRQQLSRRVRKGLSQARSWRCRRHHLWRAQIFHASLARPGAHGQSWADRGRCGRCPARTERRSGRRQVGQPPSKPSQEYQISVRAIGRLSEAAQFDSIILKTNNDGTLVRVEDVGQAELGAEDYSSDCNSTERTP